MSTHLSTLKLHQLRYGELSEDAERSARAHLAECELCAQRFANQQAERAAFEALPVPQALLDASASPVPAPANSNRAWGRIAAAVALVAVAAAVILTVFNQAPLGSDPTQIEGIRPKGHTPFVHASAFLDAPTGPARLGEGDTVHPGDRIQFEVRRPPHAWVTLAGTDATGQATVFGSWQPAGEGPEPAPFGLTLDDTLGTETLYVVYTPTEPNRAALRAEIANDDLSDDRIWEVMTLDKVR